MKSSVWGFITGQWWRHCSKGDLPVKPTFSSFCPAAAPTLIAAIIYGHLAWTEEDARHTAYPGTRLGDLHAEHTAPPWQSQTQNQDCPGEKGLNAEIRIPLILRGTICLLHFFLCSGHMFWPWVFKILMKRSNSWWHPFWDFFTPAWILNSMMLLESKYRSRTSKSPSCPPSGNNKRQKLTLFTRTVEDADLYTQTI